MGNFLANPVTEKDTLSGEDHGLSFFGVYDGHGGATVSKLCDKLIIASVLSTDAFKAAEVKTDPEMLKVALRQGMLDLDAKMRQSNPKLDSGEDRSGSTAVCGFVTPTHYVLANCGDSRVVLCRDSAPFFASDDHKPTNAIEQARIEKAEGFVQMARVCGNLAVSRSLGDYTYKDMPKLSDIEQKVSPEADMTVIERSDSDMFIVFACDGIYDVMTNEELVEFVLNQLKAGYTTTQICERLLDYCLAKNSRDNMSVVLVLLPNAPKQVEGFEAPEVIPDPSEIQSSQQENDHSDLLKQFSSMLQPKASAPEGAEQDDEEDAAE